MPYHLAIDIGASSGRHILGHIENGTIVLEEIYRFPNGAKMKDGHLCWDVDVLFSEIINGLRACKSAGKIPATMGIDTWAVDFVLLNKNGERMGDAVAYRDSRTDGMDKKVEEKITFSDLYARTGIQKQPFNTIYQLASLGDELQNADKLMMIPDYFHFLLTGVQKFEYTNASSTGLLNAEAKTWDKELLNLLGYPQKLFPELSLPGTVVGNFRQEIIEQAGFDCTVVLPATHDTGSAFMAVPAKSDTSVYLSSGTWSLLGVENLSPITTENSMKANFTNEGGYEYRYRYLKNIMGLWMIQSIREENEAYSFQQLIDMAEAAEFDTIIDVNDDAFLAPESMTKAVKNYCHEHGLPVPQTLGQLLKCVYRSLAVCYRDAIGELEALTGQKYTAIHIVGGGSNADYLNRLTAEATGLPVYAGPTEGTALGNLMAQLIYSGSFSSLAQAREAIHNSFDIKEVLPCVIQKQKPNMPLWV